MKQYYRYLQKYFKEHYGKYNKSAEWHVNPADNIWKFYIPELELEVKLVCDEKGNVYEESKQIWRGNLKWRNLR